MSPNILCNIALKPLALTNCPSHENFQTKKVKGESNFEPNPENREYKRKFLGVKKRYSRAPNNKKH